MSNYDNEDDKLAARLEELRQKHKELDTLIETKYYNFTVNDEVRRLKTQKLWFKDEIHYLENKLSGAKVNGSQ